MGGMGYQIQGTFFLTCSSSSVLLGPLAVKMILPWRAMRILGLEVEWSSGRLSDSTFSWSTIMMSTRFSNSSMTVVCRFLQKGMRASQAPLQAGCTSMISNLGLRSLQQVRKCSASRITVVSSAFFAFVAIQVIQSHPHHSTQIVTLPYPLITNSSLISVPLSPFPPQNIDNNMANVKYLAFCKSSASVPVLGATLDRGLEESLRIEIPKVIVQLKQLQLKRNERQRIKSEFGLWFCWKDAKDVYYLALCANNYPERHIYAALGQVQTHLAQLGDYEIEPDATLKLHSKEKLTEIAQRYDNIKSVDKIGEANRLLDGIKEDITDSTLKLMNNTVNLEGLERKASDLKENALMFEQSATEVEREMWCRNCKMKILIGVVVVGLICVIVIPIAVTVGKK